MPDAAPDYMSLDGAKTLAEIISHFWAKRGFKPTIRIEQASVHRQLSVYVILSDMVAGMPPRPSK